MSTVRGRLRRFGRPAESVRVLFTALLHAAEPAVVAVSPTGSVFGDALDVLGLAAAAAARLFGLARCGSSPPPVSIALVVAGVVGLQLSSSSH